jgi:hypothetical protein
MRVFGLRLKTQVLLLSTLILLPGPAVYGDGLKPAPESRAGSDKVFRYTAKKFGLPFLHTSIRIHNGLQEQGKMVCQVEASVDSRNYLGFLLRMNNRFISTMEVGSCAPIRYVKVIDQEGLLVKRKRDHQVLTFDHLNQKILVEGTEKQERQEVLLPPKTYDPLSMFAYYYFKKELHPGQDIQMSIYDGIKVRQMVFHSERERVSSNRLGEIEAVRIESTTSFSAFGDKEGLIRIWYAAGGERTPIAMELNLPVGDVKFELEEVIGRQ